ncbi:MAG TPA: HD domain-containing phosphohydrolase [Pyrinomonadaceae bacterium]|nr:HD domain-containing phosphohydrolase [Pyrinomonadaceae bacterium]
MSVSRAKDSENSTSTAFLQLAGVADQFERYENPHAGRIVAIADEIARVFQMAREDRRSLEAAALMHDLGEVAMERDYISRAGSLTEDERVDLARHPVIGEQEAARAGANRATQLLVRWHHEWWNGFGYPDALRGEQIPLAARILRVADAYAARTDSRPYRPALTEDEARTELTVMAGIEFDPRVVMVLLNLPPIEALRSFAQVPQPVEQKTGEDWNLFSSFR